MSWASGQTATQEVDRIRTVHRLSLEGELCRQVRQDMGEDTGSGEPLGGFESDTKVRLAGLTRARPSAQKDGKEPP